MANEVIMKTEGVLVKRGGMDFVIRRRGATLGTLTVAGGSISWYPKNAQTPMKKTWEAFAKLMETK